MLHETPARILKLCEWLPEIPSMAAQFAAVLVQDPRVTTGAANVLNKGFAFCIPFGLKFVPDFIEPHFELYTG
jgi:hypothetical protein